MLLEKQIRKNKDTFIAFVDLKKAYGNVQWNQLCNILEKISLKHNGRRCIYK